MIPLFKSSSFFSGKPVIAIRHLEELDWSQISNVYHYCQSKSTNRFSICANRDHPADEPDQEFILRRQFGIHLWPSQRTGSSETGSKIKSKNQTYASGKFKKSHQLTPGHINWRLLPFGGKSIDSEKSHRQWILMCFREISGKKAKVNSKIAARKWEPLALVGVPTYL